MSQGTTLQQGLDDLVAEVIDLGKEVENSIEIMVKAMQTHDAGLARMELGVDARYKVRGAEAERDCNSPPSQSDPSSNTSGISTPCSR